MTKFDTIMCGVLIMFANLSNSYQLKANDKILTYAFIIWQHETYLQ